jgi:hypothetical protein
MPLMYTTVAVCRQLINTVRHVNRATELATKEAEILKRDGSDKIVLVVDAARKLNQASRSMLLAAEALRKIMVYEEKQK